MKKIATLAMGALLVQGMGTTVLANWDAMQHMEVHAAATYNKPSNNGLITNGNDLLMLTGLSSFGTLVFTDNYIEPDFTWNYAAGLSYRIPCSDSRVFVDYERFNDAQNQSVQGASAATIVNGVTTERVEQKQYEIRGGFEHYLRFGSSFFLDVSAFLEYDRLSQTLRVLNGSSGGSNTFPSPDFIYGYSDTQNEMHGFGPGLGLKLVGIPVQQMPHWKLFAGFAASLLYANQEGFYQLLTDLPSDFIQIDIESSRAILSKFNVDFGIDYSRKVMFEGCPTLIGFTLGVKYMNIVNALKYGPFIVPSDVSFAPVGFTGSQDWGHAGPYLQFKIGGGKS